MTAPFISEMARYIAGLNDEQRREEAWGKSLDERSVEADAILERTFGTDTHGPSRWRWFA